MPKRLIEALICLLAVPFSSAADEAWRIKADYPGANIIVEHQDADGARLRQDPRDTEGWWFYWNFAVIGATGRTLTFQFTDGNVIGTQGPAISLDGGLSWAWLGTDTVRATDSGVTFDYAWTGPYSEVRFAFAPPYQSADLARFLTAHASSAALAVDTLCDSEGGLPVERIRIGRLEGAPAHRVLLTARHHSCESVASYVLEGVMAAMLENEGDGPWFREHVEALLIPFMDKDGVERGDQGKNRRPRDHGRDYAGESIYNSTRALRAFVPHWSQGRLAIAMDIHCPHIRGRDNEKVYQVGQEDPAVWMEQQRFAQCLAAVPERPLPYTPANDMPFGQSWNKASNYSAGASLFHWAADLEGLRCATAIEVPYANAGAAVVTPERARQFGGALAKALRVYLDALPDETKP